MIDNAMSEESSINKCIAINQNFSNAAERYAELMYATVPTPQGQTQASAYLRSTDNGGFLPWGGDYCTINVPVFEAK